VNLGANCSTAVALLFLGSQTVLATYLFTWEGASNLFHGTFEVTNGEMLQTNHFFIPYRCPIPFQ